MKKIMLAIAASIMLAASLSGCIVEPIGGGGGHYHHDHW